MPRSRESLNFLLVSSLLQVASDVLIKTVQSVTSRLNLTLEHLLNLHRHGFFHSWKAQECCQCDQPFKNSSTILSNQEWNLLFQKTDEDCEKATPNVGCSCRFEARGTIDPDTLTINMSSCILEKSEALKDNEVKNVQRIRDINEQLVQDREEAILTEESFDSLTEDLNKALHDMSKQCGDEYYNGVVERIQRIDASEPNEEEAKNIMERFDQVNQVNLNKKPFNLEYHRVDSMRSDISVCGSDEEEDFPGNDENNDDQEAIVLTESRILKDVDYNSVEDVELSDFDDEEDEENEYGKILQRMRENYNYLSEKCVAVGKDLSSVRKRLDGSWSVSESKAQPEEVLRQELKEIGMWRKFIDSQLEDDVRKVYLPYEDFHVSKSPGISQYIPYLKPKSTSNLYSSEMAVHPPRPTFKSYTQNLSNQKRLSKSLSSINNTFRRNLRGANTWRLEPVPRKYDQGNLSLSARDGLSKSSELVTSVSGSGNEVEKTRSFPTYFESSVPSSTVSKSSGFGIDYSKYEQCIRDTEKALGLSPGTGEDKESILCEKQHGHYLSKCKQQTNDLVNKCEKLNQKIQQLKPRFDRCEQLLSDDMEVYESIPKQDITSNEVNDIPMTSSNEQLDFSATHVAMETPNRKFASTPSNVDSQWSDMALDFQNGSADSDDEESILERRFGNSLKKLHAECDSLRLKCNQSKRHLQEARKQMHSSSSQLDFLENIRHEPRFEDDVVDNELSDIKWKHDVMDDSFDSAYLTVTSGRSTGYSTRSRPNSSRSPYNRDSAAPLVAISTPIRHREEMSPSYSSRSLYSPGYDSALEDPVEDDYVLAKKTTIPRPQTKAPILKRSTVVTTNTTPRELYNVSAYEDKTDSFEDVELELENEHGEFLEQCKSHFVDIESKSYKLRQEIRRLRIEMGLSTFYSQERKTSPYETAPTRAERFDPSEDDEENSSITSFEKELSVAEQSYGNFLSNMKSNYDSLNERSRRTKQEIHDVRRRLLEPAVCDTITCRDAYRHSYPKAAMEIHGY
ncbi:uncharacterized protein [Magallana gigas]|uniref:uncharacterized protein isoform X2 n=1 Tax=Magallana gigas TaxID=29159 RepID=UPI00333FA2E1